MHRPWVWPFFRSAKGRRGWSVVSSLAMLLVVHLPASPDGLVLSGGQPARRHRYFPEALEPGRWVFAALTGKSVGMADHDRKHSFILELR